MVAPREARFYSSALNGPDRPIFDPNLPVDDLAGALLFGRTGQRLPLPTDLLPLLPRGGGNARRPAWKLAWLAAARALPAVGRPRV